MNQTNDNIAVQTRPPGLLDIAGGYLRRVQRSGWKHQQININNLCQAEQAH